MRLAFSAIFVLLIIGLAICALKARKSHKSIGRSVSVLVAALIPPVIGNLIIISSTRQALSLHGCYVYFLGMDLVMFALLRFTMDYCQISEKNRKFRFIAWALLIAFLNRRYAISIGAASDALYEDLSISSALTAAFLFCLCKRIETLPPKLWSFVKTFSACSFGMYLMHPIFLDAVRSRHFDLTQYSAVWLYPLCYACFLLLPACLTWVMLKIPGLRKLVT